MKLLVNKGKTAEVDGRVYTTQQPRTYYVNPEKDFSCAEGSIKKEEFSKEIVTSNLGIKFHCFNASFIDSLNRIKKGAQWINPKDSGTILSETGVNKNSIIVEGGSGSGGLSCFFSNYVKHIYSYDIREDHIKIAKKNAEDLGLKNITFYNDNLNNIKEENVDLIVIDMPTPEDVIDNISKKVKRGGFIAIYVPSTVQIESIGRIVQNKENLLYLKTIEVIQRPWKVKDKAVRPLSVGHTAFLMFVRKI